VSGESFREWLLRSRAGLSLSRDDLSRRSGVSAQQIANIETGKTTQPRASTLRALRAAIEAGPTATESTRPPQPDADDCANYEILHLIAEGAEGSVYVARERTLLRDVAIKFLPSSSNAALAQARLLARASHPNVVRIHGLVRLRQPREKNVVDAIDMELLRGTTLLRWLNESPNLDDAPNIVGGLIAGVEHLHRLRLAHQDLHPKNVMIENSHATLIDPLHTETFAALSPDQVETRIQTDLRRLCRIVCEILSKAGVSPEATAHLESLGGAARISGDAIRAAVAQALATPPVPSQVDPVSSESAAQEPAGSARRPRRLFFAIAITAALVALFAFLLATTTTEESPHGLLASAAQSPTSTQEPPWASSLPLPSSSATDVRRDASPEVPSPPTCVLPAFETGAASRFLASSNSRDGAESLRKQVAMLMAREPGGAAWTTGLRHHRRRVGDKDKWLVTVETLSPKAAHGLCGWLTCRGWSQYCSEKLPR
jgi:serine/threonine protein kinase/DNA-binding XRE family transcriptional regulator